MQATVADLRYPMKNVLKEGTITPAARHHSKDSMMAHPFFGSWSETEISVEETVQRLRAGRYDAL